MKSSYCDIIMLFTVNLTELDCQFDINLDKKFLDCNWTISGIPDRPDNSF